MVSNRPRFNTVEPWGLTNILPPMHPALLNRPFTDVIRALDPVLAVRFSKYVSSFNSDLKKGVNISDLQEYLLLILDMYRSGLIEEDEFHSTFELVDSRTVDQIINHEELGEETLTAYLCMGNAARLSSDLMTECACGKSPSNQGIWFDVDMENLTLGRPISPTSSITPTKYKT